MRRRLRKKRRLGEFQELGFEVAAELRAPLSDADLQAFVDRWLDAVEARELAFGGGAGGGREPRLDGFVTRIGRGSATEEDRTAIDALLAGDTLVVRHQVGALIDAWR